ncbi:MAG: excisionase [Rhodospirillaceae bacterium]|nr:excisionase [Rhodospirillaceae bacterium]
MSIQSTGLSRDAEVPGKPLAVSVRNMCRLLDIGNTKAWELIAEGRVTTFMIGRKRLVVLASIERLLPAEEP